MEFIIYVVAALVVASFFELSFKKSFVGAAILGIILTPLVSIVLLIVAAAGKSKVSDSWEPEQYEVSKYQAQLPKFEKPRLSDNSSLSVSLRGLILSKEADSSIRLNTFTREKHMRRLLEADKREYNRQLFAFAEKQESALNRFLDDEILHTLRTGLLAQTLKKDDFIDLASQKMSPLTAQFSSPDEIPIGAPRELELREEPRLESTSLPKLLRWLPKLLRNPIQHSYFTKDHEIWLAESEDLESRRALLKLNFEEAEAQRIERLSRQRSEFELAAELFTQEAQAHNAELEMQIQGFEAGEKSTVEQYALRVLRSSEYPDEVVPGFDCHFDEDTRELEVSVKLQSADRLEPVVVKYKLVKSRASLEEVPLAKTEFRKIYSLTIMQILIRAAHEVSEADRSDTIQSISVQGVLPDKMSGREVPVALLAGTPNEFLADKLRGEISALFKSLGGVISSDPISASPVSTKGSIRGK